MKAAVLLAFFLGGLLLAAIIYAIDVWLSIQGGTISEHGLLALALGAGGTLFLGVVLMGLVFYSRRKGYDDEVGKH